MGRSDRGSLAAPVVTGEHQTHSDLAGPRLRVVMGLLPLLRDSGALAALTPCVALGPVFNLYPDVRLVLARRG